MNKPRCPEGSCIQCYDDLFYKKGPEVNNYRGRRSVVPHRPDPSSGEPRGDERWGGTGSWEAPYPFVFSCPTGGVVGVRLRVWETDRTLEGGGCSYKRNRRTVPLSLGQGVRT